MWLAKKQKMLQVLEDAYPNSVNTPDLLRLEQYMEHYNSLNIFLYNDSLEMAPETLVSFPFLMVQITLLGQ